MNEVLIGGARLLNIDCMEFMKGLPDKHFELAIVDPPYGLGLTRPSGTYARKELKNLGLTNKHWDAATPNAQYFMELKRVSNNQIIWGANNMVQHLTPSSGWVCWYKTNELKGRCFSEIELAYTSFKMRALHFEFRPACKEGTRIHPTQKPVKLYEWLLKNYAKPGDKILDTHGGSMTSVIACLKMGFEITCTELDRDYFEAGVQRVRDSQRQDTLFSPEIENKPMQQAGLC